MHKNLFEFGATSKEIYMHLQREQRKDERKVAILILCFVACLLLAGLYGFSDGWGWVLAAIFFWSWKTDLFVDASNRNFFMHSIDWVEQSRLERHEE